MVNHAGTVSQLSDNMDSINRFTGQTADAVAGNAEALEELRELSDELRHNLSGFELPSEPAPSDPQQQTLSVARRVADRAVLNE